MRSLKALYTRKIKKIFRCGQDFQCTLLAERNASQTPPPRVQPDLPLTPTSHDIADTTEDDSSSPVCCTSAACPEPPDSTTSGSEADKAHVLSNSEQVQLDPGSAGQSHHAIDNYALWLSNQLKREAKYLIFDGEDESDYTEGPVRIVNAPDGVNPSCGALLLNLDFSRKLQAALDAQRELMSENLVATQRIQVLADFEQKLRSQISKHEHRLTLLAGAVQRKSSDSTDSNATEIAVLEIQLEKLQLLQLNNEAEQQSLTMSLQSCGDMFIEKQIEANVYLEEALVNASLMQPFEVPVTSAAGIATEIDVDQEYQNLCTQLQTTGQIAADAGIELHACNENFEPSPLSPDEQLHEDLRQAYEATKQALQVAELQFDSRDLVREQEHLRNAFLYSHSAGAEGEAQETFDLRWLDRNRKLTRTLIEAEEAYTQAKIAAVRAGVQLGNNDQSSAFSSEDGAYATSQEEAMKASVPKRQVTDWIEKTAEADVAAETAHGAACQSTQVDLGDWAAAEVEIGDSHSTIALGKNKSRIQRWREACTC